MLRKLSSLFTAIVTPKRFMLLVVVFLAWLLAYCIYLDRIVARQFDGQRFALPARVYARPLEIFVGKQLTAQHLVRELRMLGYQSVAEVLGPAEFHTGSQRVVVQSRKFDFWDGRQGSQRVAIEFAQGQVRALTDMAAQAPINLFRLEPVAIGGIYTRDNEDRQLVSLQQVPQHLVGALLAVEDQRFYDHPGVDVRSLARALWATATGGGVQGGSTLTQQLVKNMFLTPERTVGRKLKEMLMALLLEKRYDKNDILETYLNEVYFGQDGARAIHGVALASRHWFGRGVEQLEPHHSALLVALLKGPTLYNPRRNPERALSRRNLVLREAHEQGYLSAARLESALKRPLDVMADSGSGLSQYPAFLELVFQQLRRDYRETDLRSEGLRVFTTLDPVVQQFAEAAAVEVVPRLERQRNLSRGHLETAIVINEPNTGEVVALVGGRRPDYQGFNRALDARRPIGSLMKPVVYLTAVARPKDYSLASMLNDRALTWQTPGAEPWQPQNYDQREHGDVPLWAALAHSYNLATAHLGLELGVDQVLATARNLGVQEHLNPYASTFLGAAELSPMSVAQMYQSLASGGFFIPLRAIREVTTLEGKPLNRYGIEVRQVMSAETAYLMTRALQLAVSEGTGRRLYQSLPAEMGVAGKTGTTDDFRDSWFAGFTANYAAVVWVGNDNNAPTGLTGSSGAMAIWAALMKNLALQPLQPVAPANITMASSHREHGGRTDSRCQHAIELPFVKGAEPRAQIACNGRERSTSKRKNWFERLF